MLNFPEVASPCRCGKRRRDLVDRGVCGMDAATEAYTDVLTASRSTRSRSLLSLNGKGMRPAVSGNLLLRTLINLIEC